MGEITLNVTQQVEQQTTIDVPAYRKITEKNYLAEISKFRDGKLIRKPSNRYFIEEAYVKVDVDQSTLILKKYNRDTNTVIYDIERGSNIQDDNILVQLLQIPDTEISSVDWEIIVSEAIEFVNGTLSNEDVIPELPEIEVGSPE
jgi:hypothetical protein